MVREWNKKLGPELGKKLNDQYGRKLGEEWNARLNPKSAPQGKSDEAKLHLPKPIGPHPVGTSTRELTDQERLSSHNSPKSGPRRLVVQIWYPAASDSDAKPAKYNANSKAWNHVVTNTGLRPLFAKSLTKCPLILICPGRGVNHRAYTALAESLASQGYVVAAVGMPGVGQVVFADGQVIHPITLSSAT